MAELEQEKSALEAKLSSALPPAEIADAGRRLKAIGDEVQTLEERWLTLTEEMDNIGS